MSKKLLFKMVALGLFCGQMNFSGLAFAGCGWNCIGGAVSDGLKGGGGAIKKGLDDLIEETHRAGHGIVYATKIAGKDVSREFKNSADAVVDEWGRAYRGLVPDEKLRYILNSTAALATVYYLPEASWLIILERKVTIAAEKARQKKAARSQVESDALDVAEEAMFATENTVVLADTPEAGLEYEAAMQEVNKEYDECIYSAGESKKAQRACVAEYNAEKAKKDLLLEE